MFRRRYKVALATFAAISLTLPLAANALSYSDFSDLAGMTLNGSATQVGTVLRLTDSSYQAGSAYVTKPVWLGPGGAFTTHFQFRISKGTFYGIDGFAFVIQRDARGPSALGASGAWLGFSGTSSDKVTPSIAIEFDTWRNWPYDQTASHPIAVDADGSIAHHFIDLQCVDDCTVVGLLNDGKVFDVWISYDGATLQVRLEKELGVGGVWTLSYPIDIDGILGGEPAYVGFSAGTSSYSNYYQMPDILSWEFPQMEIDVQPDSDENAVNLGSKGVVPVAFITTDDFDALELDASTIAFGPAGTPIAHVRAHVEDVDGDGDMDLLAHFRIELAGIGATDHEVCVTARTLAGAAYRACDNVTIVPPAKP
jgi:hypothetical protein